MSDLKNSVMPGDIVNIEKNNFIGQKDWWKIFSTEFATQVIMGEQKILFGKKSEWKDHHTMVYFNDDRIFSVHPPKPAWLGLKEFDKGDNRIISIYRYTKKVLDKRDLEIMTAASQEIIDWNQPYDVGQLVDMLMQRILGYAPYNDKVNLFDAGKKKIVCSVGGAVVYNKRRIVRWQETKGKEDLPQLFSKLNPKAWSKKWIKEFKGFWDLNQSYPANFSNTQTHFDGEFKLIGKFLSGDKIA